VPSTGPYRRPVMTLILLVLSLLNADISNKPASARGHVAKPSIIQSQTGTGL